MRQALRIVVRPIKFVGGCLCIFAGVALLAIDAVLDRYTGRFGFMQLPGVILFFVGLALLER